MVEKGPPEFEKEKVEVFEEVFDPTSEENEEEEEDVPHFEAPSFEEEVSSILSESDTETLDSDQSARYQQRERKDWLYYKRCKWKKPNCI